LVGQPVVEVAIIAPTGGNPMKYMLNFKGLIEMKIERQSPRDTNMNR
jgi:hypothetical protein